MTDILDHPYECDANWKGPALTASTDWIYRFTADDVAELETALQHVKSKGLDIPAVGEHAEQEDDEEPVAGAPQPREPDRREQNERREPDQALARRQPQPGGRQEALLGHHDIFRRRSGPKHDG